MRLAVDERCSGQGRCYTVAPELLEPDDDVGYVSIRGQSIIVPDESHDLARKAARWCPERAIELSEDTAS